MLPHGWCLYWNYELLVAHISADLIIGLAYYAIPVVLWRARRALENRLGRHVLLSFVLFIIACGLTHHVEVLIVYKPWYWFQATVKAFTATLSAVTAVQLARLSVAFRDHS
jgi:hypothetical protein